MKGKKQHKNLAIQRFDRDFWNVMRQFGLEDVIFDINDMERALITLGFCRVNNLDDIEMIKEIWVHLQAFESVKPGQEQ